MRITFQEDFEHEIGDKVYCVEVSGQRETDFEGRIFAELDYLIVIDEEGNELDDTSDAYNDVEEYVCYDREFLFENTGFDEDYDDEEEIPQWGMKL